MPNAGPLHTIGLLQFSPVYGDIQANIRKIDELLKMQPQADIWVLPELASSGYNFASAEEAFKTSEPINDSHFIQFLKHKAKETGSILVSGFNEREDNILYNSAVMTGPDGLWGHYRKLHLFNREKEYFKPGNLGLPVFDTPLGKVGLLVCFDWMFPEIWRLLALRGAALICHPSNLVLPYCQSAIPGYSLTNRIFIATTNRTGTEKELTFTGQSVLVNPAGDYLIQAGPDEEGGFTHQVDLSMAEDKKMTPYNDAFKDRRCDYYKLTEKNNTRDD